MPRQQKNPESLPPWDWTEDSRAMFMREARSQGLHDESTTGASIMAVLSAPIAMADVDVVGQANWWGEHCLPPTVAQLDVHLEFFREYDYAWFHPKPWALCPQFTDANPNPLGNYNPDWKTKCGDTTNTGRVHQRGLKRGFQLRVPGPSDFVRTQCAKKFAKAGGSQAGNGNGKRMG